VDDSLDQHALVADARRGDPRAWEALYRRLYPLLMSYASRRLGADGARDAVSEAMARAVARISRFAWEGGGFDAWIFGILRHVVIDAQRFAVGRAPANDLDEPVSGEPGPLDHLLGAERSAAVRTAFAQLGPLDQEVLELRVVAGLSSDEVAAVVGKKSGAVRMAQARALERLRELLEEHAT
jgi:RNA polymerase sigma-70 factor (ECF subfamily)